MLYLRSELGLPPDKLLAVVREFIEPSMSRSALHRLLLRRGCSCLFTFEQPTRTSDLFKAYAAGFVHVDMKDLPQMADEDSRRYVFLAIDRAPRCVFIAIKKRSAACARSSINDLVKAASFRIHTVLTDNGMAAFRLFGSRARTPSGEH